MSITELYEALDHVDSTRKKRMKMSSMVLNHPEDIGNLLEIAFYVDDPISCKACWVLEFIAKQRLDLLLPYVEPLIKNSGTLHLDSAIRPIAKICECLAHSYFINKDLSTCKALKDEHLSQMATSCFDWLIGEQKVAAKAYSMTCLLLLGRKQAWIWPELRMVLERNYSNGSPAYQARARMTLAKLR